MCGIIPVHIRTYIHYKMGCQAWFPSAANDEAIIDDGGRQTSPWLSPIAWMGVSPEIGCFCRSEQQQVAKKEWQQLPSPKCWFIINSKFKDFHLINQSVLCILQC